MIYLHINTLQTLKLEYRDPDHGHCWLKTDQYMVWSFAGPVLVVIIINAAFLASALRIVQLHR